MMLFPSGCVSPPPIMRPKASDTDKVKQFKAVYEIEHMRFLGKDPASLLGGLQKPPEDVFLDIVSSNLRFSEVPILCS